MKTIAKILFVTVLTLGAVSCTDTDQAETEELYIDSPDEGEVDDEREGSD